MIMNVHLANRQNVRQESESNKYSQNTRSYVSIDSEEVEAVE